MHLKLEGVQSSDKMHERSKMATTMVKCERIDWNISCGFWLSLTYFSLSEFLLLFDRFHMTELAKLSSCLLKE